MEEKISIKDVEEFEHLFSIVPPFILKRMAKKNTNLVKKFPSQVQSQLDSASDAEMKKLHIVLNSDVDELQAIMDEAYNKTNKKQFKILADPDYKEFIEINIAELKKIVN